MPKLSCCWNGDVHNIHGNSLPCVWPCDSHCRIGIRIRQPQFFEPKNPKILFFSIAMRIFWGSCSSLISSLSHNIYYLIVTYTGALGGRAPHPSFPKEGGYCVSLQNVAGLGSRHEFCPLRASVHPTTQPSQTQTPLRSQDTLKYHHKYLANILRLPSHCISSAG